MAMTSKQRSLRNAWKVFCPPEAPPDFTPCPGSSASRTRSLTSALTWSEAGSNRGKGAHDRAQEMWYSERNVVRSQINDRQEQQCNKMQAPAKVPSYDTTYTRVGAYSRHGNGWKNCVRT